MWQPNRLDNTLAIATSRQVGFRRAMGGLFVLAVYLMVLITANNVIAEELVAPAKKNTPHINYMLHCQGCHLPGGVGHPGIVPSLAGNVGKFLNVEGGRKYLVQVPGSAQSTLDDGELAAVLNWLLPKFDPVNTPLNFQPYNAQEIARYRSVPIQNVTEIRTKLLGAYSPTRAQ